MRPWLASLTLAEAVAASQGYSSENGADMQLAAEARAHGLAVGYFETVEEQLAFLASPSETEQVSALKLTIDQLETTPEIYDELYDAWRAGDVPQLAALLSEGMEEVPEYWDVMVGKRNAAWVEVIDALLHGEERVFVAVGAGHLVGKKSVIELLQDRGFTVTRH
jgi:uncharacterized protein YbaP (TraB family)